ncbi:TonB-dependent receptor [Rhodobacterales bacterium HKCCE4037]|nr:TonB-dependent receptor [Rhodobacterales bacterium HKCCE4037]
MALVLAAVAVPVHAQDTTTPLGRIVFGWGTDQVALDTPLAVTVIDQEEIEQEQATTVGEFFDSVPGVQGIGSERVGGQTLNIRGWGSVPSDGGHVVVQQDGATQTYQQYRMGTIFTDPNLFCNIEVLRGPASATLYGSAAIGGVVRFETCDADDYLTEGQTSQFRFSAAGETNGEGGNVGLRYASRLDEDLDVFANLNYRAADDFVDGDGTEIGGSAFTALSGVVSGTYRFSSTRQLRVIYERWYSDIDDTAYEQTGTSNFGPMTNAFGNVDRETTDQTLSFIYESAESFGDLNVTLAYASTDVAQTNATDPYSLGGQLFEDSDYGYGTLSLDARVTEDFLLGSVAGDLTYGATLSRQERTGRLRNGDLIGFHPEGTQTIAAAFVQADFDFGNGLVLTPGVRFEWHMSQGGPDDPAFATDLGEDVEMALISPKVAFTYEISEEWGLFGSLSRTQRGPTLDELYTYTSSQGAPRTQATGLDPETADSVELGFTYTTAGLFNPNDAFDARVTAFYTHVEDLIVTDTTVAYRNVDEAELYGLEIEAAYVGDTWFADFAASVMKGRNLTDDTVWPDLPQDNLHLTLGRSDPTTGITYGWTLNAFADIDYGVGNSFAGYATHDLFASWEPQSGSLQGLEFRVGVDNVLDRTYRNALDGENGRGLTGRFTVARVWDF